MAIHVETVGFGELARDLRTAGATVGRELTPVVKKGAGNVKRGMRDDMSGSRHFGQVSPSIGYDFERSPASVEAVIGAETGGRVVGDLAHLAYFGGVNGGGGTVRDPEWHAHEEAPRFERAVAAVVDGLL